jgi:hypothetical protein
VLTASRFRCRSSISHCFSWCSRSVLPYLYPVSHWLVRKANWPGLMPLVSSGTPYDAVMWTWKLAPLVVTAWLADKTFTGYSPRVLVCCVTIVMLKLWHVMEPHGRSGLTRKTAFWSHVLVLSFQGYLIAIESDNAPVLPERFTIAYGFVMLTILTFIIVTVCLLVMTFRELWSGPAVTQARNAVISTRQRAVVKRKSFTANIWMEDYIKLAKYTQMSPSM